MRLHASITIYNLNQYTGANAASAAHSCRASTFSAWPASSIVYGAWLEPIGLKWKKPIFLISWK